MQKLILFLLINTIAYSQFSFLSNVIDKSKKSIETIKYTTTTNYTVNTFSDSSLKDSITNGGLNNYFTFGSHDKPQTINFFYGQRYTNRLKDGIEPSASVDPDEDITLIEENNVSLSYTSQFNKSLTNAYKYRLGVHSLTSNLDHSSKIIHGGIWQEKRFADGKIRGLGINIFYLQHENLGENYSRRDSNSSEVNTLQISPFMHYRNTYHYHKIGLNFIQADTTGITLEKDSVTSLTYDYLFDDGIDFGYIVKIQLGEFAYGVSQEDILIIHNNEDIYTTQFGVGVRYNLSNTGYWSFRIDYVSGDNVHEDEKSFKGINYSFNIHSRF